MIHVTTWMNPENVPSVTEAGTGQIVHDSTRVRGSNSQTEGARWSPGAGGGGWGGLSDGHRAPVWENGTMGLDGGDWLHNTVTALDPTPKNGYSGKFYDLK